MLIPTYSWESTWRDVALTGSEAGKSDGKRRGRCHFMRDSRTHMHAHSSFTAADAAH